MVTSFEGLSTTVISISFSAEPQLDVVITLYVPDLLTSILGVFLSASSLLFKKPFVRNILCKS